MTIRDYRGIIMSFIDLDGITFAYEEDNVVFKDFSFSVEKGETVVVRGDNGSGKTTLFRIINGLSFPSKGQYVFDGIVVDKKYLDDNRNSKLFHKRVGYLFQNPDTMLFNGSVYDEIAFGPRQMGLSEAEVKTRVAECMEMLGIETLAAKAPYHLSGGQKKKVALAAVIALNPEVLVLDEPLAGLDKASGQVLAEIIRELKEAGKTLIVATHDDDFAKLIGDREIKLD